MKRRFRNRILIGSMLLFVSISIVTNVITYEMNKRNTRQAILDKNMLALTALCADLSREIVNMQNMASMVMVHPNVYDYIKYCYSEEEFDVPFYDKTQYYEEIQRYFYGMHLYEPPLDSISIIIGGNKLDHFAVRSGIATESLYNIVNSDWYATVCEQDEAYFLGCHNSYFAKSTDVLKRIEDKQYFSVAKSVRNMTTKEVYGVILCCYDAEKLVQKYSTSLAEEVHTFMVVEKGTNRILLSNQSEEENVSEHLGILLDSDDTSIIYDGGIALQNGISGTNYVVIADVPMIASMHNAEDRILQFSISITMIGICIFFVLTWIYSHRIAKPVNAILDTIQGMESGNLMARIDANKMVDEFVDIAQRLNDMGEKMIQLMSETQQKEREKNEATFLTLQMQINPHFICNTLNSIRLMALMHEQKEISDILEATTQILSDSFKSSSPYTTLGKDIRMIRAYASIMRMRYGNIFEIRYNISQDTLSCKILRFIIQPCIENAILHGMLPSEKPGEICISSMRKNDELIIEICDNGVGCEKDLENLALNGPRNSAYNSIGLGNVLSRIKLMYGSTARVTLQSKVRIGTRICFYIPAEKQEE